MNLEELSQNILAATRKVVLSSSKLPNPGTEYSLNLSVPAVRNNLLAKRNQVLNVVEKMLGCLNVKAPAAAIADNNQWQDDADVEDFLDAIVDANDQVFEHVGDALDIAAGLKKDAPELVVVGTPRNRFKKHAPTSANNETQENSPANKSSDVFRLIAARIVERPQLKFPDKIDNSNSFFVPKLKTKPFALKPLEDSFTRLDDGDGSYQNPYSFELQSLVVDDEFVEPSSFGPPKSLEETPLIYVDSAELLTSMIKDLSVVSEFAVDLEHHSYRTFLGFTCLIQISTRHKDYIIDALSLRGHIHELLPLFANPSILKVFHGADSDIIWLQRDFGIYVVNMFDTHKASKVLDFPKLSLAYLLDRYLHVDVDKRFQLADWRIRPLPDELIRYARSDTHHLLHVCDLMKSDLIERAKYNGNNDHFCLVRRVFDESATVCSTHYEKPMHTDESHLELYERSRKVFNSQQLAALRLLFGWRDKIARREDESTSYVLPNHMLLQMAELLPKEPTGVLACCQPIPPLVKQNVHEMHAFILQARRQPMQQVENPSVAAAKAHLVSVQMISPELEALSCPLDSTTQLPGDDSKPNIVVKVVSMTNLPPSKISSFVEVLMPESGASRLRTTNALLAKAIDLFSGYVLRSESLHTSERKPTPVPYSESTPQPARPPLKRHSSAIAASAPNVDLQLLPNSSSPAKMRRKGQESFTPLVPASAFKLRRKHGPKFVEKVAQSNNLDDSGNNGAGHGKRERGNKLDRRRDFHEKQSRQTQSFSSAKKMTKR